jgi:glycine cleavage system transcriptional repressor
MTAKSPAQPAKLQRYAISVMFHDQVGIVADVSDAIRRLNGNLLDVSQTVLQEYFTMILLADFSQETSKQAILDALQQIPSLKGACFGVLLCPEDHIITTPVKPEDSYVLTASGPDHPGLVATVAAYLKERGINIVDLSSRNHQGNYTMIWQIQIPKDLDVLKLQKSMKIAFQDQLDIGLRHDALFRVTNEI